MNDDLTLWSSITSISGKCGLLMGIRCSATQNPLLKLDDVDDYILTVHLGRQHFTAIAKHDYTGRKENNQEKRENVNLPIYRSRKYSGVLFVSLITRDLILQHEPKYGREDSSIEKKELLILKDMPYSISTCTKIYKTEQRVERYYNNKYN